MKRLQRPLSFLGLLLFLMSGCQEPAPATLPARTETPAPVLINIGVSDSAAPLAELAAAYETEQAAINFVAGNSAALWNDLQDGVFDALLVHQLPVGAEVWYSPVALDGLVIIVHPDNPLTGLTRSQLQAIYSGRISNWRDVGGPDKPISLIGRETGAGVRRLFNSLIMAEQRPSINTLVVPDNESLLVQVAGDPAAIGYTMMGAVADGEEESPDVRALTIDEVPPTSNSTGTQNYPLTVPVYFVSPAEPAGPASEGAELRAFLAWLQSAEGQQIVGEKYGRVR